MALISGEDQQKVEKEINMNLIYFSKQVQSKQLNLIQSNKKEI